MLSNAAKFTLLNMKKSCLTDFSKESALFPISRHRFERQDDMNQLLVSLKACHVNCFSDQVVKLSIKALLVLSSASFAMASSYSPSDATANQVQEAQNNIAQEQSSIEAMNNSLPINDYGSNSSSPFNHNYQFQSALQASAQLDAKAVLSANATTINEDKDQESANLELNEKLLNAYFEASPLRYAGFCFTGSAVLSSNQENAEKIADPSFPQEYQNFISNKNYGEQSETLFALGTNLFDSHEPILLQAAQPTHSKAKDVKQVKPIFANTNKLLAPNSDPYHAFSATTDNFEQSVKLLQESFLEAQQALDNYSATAQNIDNNKVDVQNSHQVASLEPIKPADIQALEQINQALTKDTSATTTTNSQDTGLSHDNSSVLASTELTEHTAASESSNLPESPAQSMDNSVMADNSLQASITTTSPNPSENYSASDSDSTGTDGQLETDNINDMEYSSEFMVDHFISQDSDNASDALFNDDSSDYDAYNDMEHNEEQNLERVYNQNERVYYGSKNPEEAKENSPNLNNSELHVSSLFESTDRSPNTEHALGAQDTEIKAPAISGQQHYRPKNSLEREIANSQASEVTKSVLGSQLFSKKSISNHTHIEDNDEVLFESYVGTSANTDSTETYTEESSESNNKGRIFYTGTKNPVQEQDELTKAINEFKNTNRATQYTKDSYYGSDDIDVDTSVNLEDLKSSQEDDTTLFYPSLNYTDDNSVYASDENHNSQSGANKQKPLSRADEYRQNLLEYDMQAYGANIAGDPKKLEVTDIISDSDNVDTDLKSANDEDIPYWQKNKDWKFKDQSSNTNFAQDFALSKEEEAIYGDFSLDISTHHDDYIDDIDESKIDDYIIATNEEGFSPISKRVLTRTRITSYALRFNENPFLPIDELQREQSACINGKGYSCYLVGRHYDGLSSLGRNNKRRMIAASELAKAHELYPHIPITGAVFDHLLHTIVFYRRGCHLKNSLSCRLLLSAYGRFGGLIALGKTTVNNKQLGIRYLEAGCHFEEPRSCANLAAMHLNGYSTFEPSTKNGISLYVRSCRIARTITNELRVIDPNLGIGCLELGRMYLNSGLFKDGTYIQQDYVKAHHYLHHACNLRSAAACKILKDNFTNHEHLDIPMPVGETFRESGNMNKKNHNNAPVRSTPLNLYLGHIDTTIVDKQAKHQVLRNNISISYNFFA